MLIQLVGWVLNPILKRTGRTVVLVVRRRG